MLKHVFALAILLGTAMSVTVEIKGAHSICEAASGYKKAPSHDPFNGIYYQIGKGMFVNDAGCSISRHYVSPSGWVWRVNANGNHKLGDNFLYKARATKSRTVPPQSGWVVYYNSINRYRDNAYNFSVTVVEASRRINKDF